MQEKRISLTSTEKKKTYLNIKPTSKKHSKFYLPASHITISRTYNVCPILLTVGQDVVQFYPWFKFYFPLFQTHYHVIIISQNRGK